MGILNFLGLGWKPRDRFLYKSWSSRKWTWAGQKIERILSIKKATVYIKANALTGNEGYEKCTFRVAKGKCTIRIKNFGFNGKRYKEYWIVTPTTNIKFEKHTIRETGYGETYGGKYSYPKTLYQYSISINDMSKCKFSNKKP